MPWYRGFRGTIVRDRLDAAGAPAHFSMRGCVARVAGTAAAAAETYAITELPVDTSIQAFKDMLEAWSSPDAAKKPPLAAYVADYREAHTEDAIRFVVTLTRAGADRLAQLGAPAFFKLVSSVDTNNLVLFDGGGKLRRYASAEHIVDDFFPHRLALYERRRARLVAELGREHAAIESKARFVRAVVDGSLALAGASDEALLAALRAHAFVPLPTAAAPSLADYEYLLALPVRSLTAARVRDLETQRDRVAAELARVRASTAASLWRADLAALDAALAADPAYAYVAEARSPKRARDEEGATADDSGTDE